MSLTSFQVHLLDVNVVLALVDQAHTHHDAAAEWFLTSDLQWSLCPFTEAGVLRFLTRPRTGGFSMEQASSLLNQMRTRPGYHYQPITADWQTLTAPFARRLHGHNQVADAFLLGLAVREGLVLTTFDRGLLHMAGPLREYVLVLAA